MRIDVRLGLALLLAIAVSGGGRAARAQVAGAATGAQAGGPVVAPQVGGPRNGGLFDPLEGDNRLSDPGAAPAISPLPSRVSPFNRVTTARRGAVSAPSRPGRIAGPGEALAWSAAPRQALQPACIAAGRRRPGSRGRKSMSRRARAGTRAGSGRRVRRRCDRHSIITIRV